MTSPSQDNMKIVREAVIRANPDILKLEFGCEGIYDDNSVKLLRYGMDFQNVDGPNVYVWQKEDGSRYHTSDNRYVEILGRPIRLADVLLAIEKNRTTDFFFVTTTDFLCMQDSKTDEELMVWNLREDDLSKQSPETLEFLANLLKHE